MLLSSALLYTSLHSDGIHAAERLLVYREAPRESQVYWYLLVREARLDALELELNVLFLPRPPFLLHGGIQLR